MGSARQLPPRQLAAQLPPWLMPSERHGQTERRHEGPKKGEHSAELGIDDDDDKDEGAHRSSIVSDLS